MAKTRVNRKELKRLKKKAAVSHLTELRLKAGYLTSQADLDTLLLPVTDLDKRQKYFEFLKPFLKFPNPVCPSPIIQPGIVIPR